MQRGAIDGSFYVNLKLANFDSLINFPCRGQEANSSASFLLRSALVKAGTTVSLTLSRALASPPTQFSGRYGASIRISSRTMMTSWRQLQGSLCVSGTYVLASALKISCASFVTPTPIIAEEAYRRDKAWLNLFSIFFWSKGGSGG